jgi:acyl dehydratase
MPLLELDAPADLKAYVGKEAVVTDWVIFSQGRITQFAEATDDRQWIHLDQERARKESPYKATIAHGFLTLSYLSCFVMTAMKVGGVQMAINYGLNRVRFPAAVPEGSKVRARFTLAALKEIPNGLEANWAATVEREGSEKPCCVAEWLVRYYSESKQSKINDLVLLLLSGGFSLLSPIIRIFWVLSLSGF